MNTDDILSGLYDRTLVGDKPAVVALTQQGVELGLEPETMLFEALIPALETFIEAIHEHQPDVVGFSAFLTTTMPMFKVNIEAIEKAGLRDEVAIMVGGAPVTQEYANAVGADGYAPDAATATRRAKELIRERRAAAAA